jgi:hypothetical protein
MNNDIDHKFKPGFATDFAIVPNGAAVGLILRLQSSAFSGEGRWRSDLAVCIPLVGIDTAKL